jgi:hypothetical protein
MICEGGDSGGRVKPRCEVPSAYWTEAMSFTAAPDELERFGLRRLATPPKHPQDRIEHGVQLLAHIFRKKPKYKVTVLLQQVILPPVATIRDGIREVLVGIEFDDNARVGAQQVDLKDSEAVERDRQRHVETEASTGLRQCVQSPVEERLGCTSCPRGTSASCGIGRAVCTNKLASGVSTPSLMSLRTLPE